MTGYCDTLRNVRRSQNCAISCPSITDLRLLVGDGGLQQRNGAGDNIADTRRWLALIAAYLLPSLLPPGATRPTYRAPSILTQYNIHVTIRYTVYSRRLPDFMATDHANDTFQTKRMCS